jgi:hypothetical protein
MRSTRPPTDRPRRDNIEAVVAAHNAADREPLLPPEAARLLDVMFRRGDLCQRSLNSLMLDGFNQRRLLRLLGLLAEAGFLSREASLRRGPNTYRLHLPTVRP